MSVLFLRCVLYGGVFFFVMGGGITGSVFHQGGQGEQHYAEDHDGAHDEDDVGGNICSKVFFLLHAIVVPDVCLVFVGNDLHTLYS